MSEGGIASTAPVAVTPRVVMARAAKQRERILDAAERCFIKHGFHAASMAHIAQTADMSAGLIYRYFSSKADIVKAITERHLESEHHQQICKLDTAEAISRSLLEILESWRRRDDPKLNATLMLELTAESTRDPQIARAVRAKDKALGINITDVVRRGTRARGLNLTDAQARSRAVMLQCLVEGLAMRVVRDPKLKRATVKPALEAIIDALMS
jgi:AcrR family transcriptional regulator